MAYRKKYRAPDGETKTTESCYFKLTLADGAVKELAAGTGVLKDAQAIERRCKRIISLKMSGQVIDAETHQWLTNSAAKALLERLASLRVIDGAAAERRKTIDELLGNFGTDLLRRVKSKRNADAIVKRIQMVCREAGFQKAQDINARGTDEIVHTLCTKAGRACSSWTKRHYMTAMRRLTKWMVRHSILLADPLAECASITMNVRARIHEPLTMTQFAKLIHATENSKPKTLRGQPMMSGRQRATLYAIAVHTGARFNQLRALRVEHLDLQASPPTALFIAEASKNGRERKSVLMDPVLIERLAELAANKMPKTRLFSLPAGGMTRWLSHDLENAGIPVRVSETRVRDFHGLRATTATLMIQGGADPRTVQQRLDHADIRTTLNIYTHVNRDMETKGLNTLPKMERTA